MKALIYCPLCIIWQIFPLAGGGNFIYYRYGTSQCTSQRKVDNSKGEIPQQNKSRDRPTCDGEGRGENLSLWKPVRIRRLTASRIAKVCTT